MPKKNYMEFGSLTLKNKKKIYENITGDLYDSYMLGRYFDDMFNLYKLTKNKIKFSQKFFHDVKDFNFNLINYFLIKLSKTKKFYEFGFTIYEKIYYFKYFNLFYKKKINLKKIKFHGYDISEKFKFFSKNFHKELNILLSNKFKTELFRNTIFFSKGVTLLYEKKNLIYLNDFFKYCECGSFDISIFPNKRIVSLNTGYKLYYPSYKDFKNLIKTSNKKFFYRNIKKNKSKIYLEILFGKKKINDDVNKMLSIFFKKNKYKDISKYLSFEKFKPFDLSLIR